MSELIVYRQSELDDAIKSGCKEIVLCAGIFVIPKATDVTFKRIGPVLVTVDCTKDEAESVGMVFCGIYPTYKTIYGMYTRENMCTVAIGSSSYVSSGSFGSGNSSWYYEYEFEYGFSFSDSFSTSYASSYSMPVGSYSLYNHTSKSIRVFGYGINLI